METVKLTVSGMTCQGCVRSVKRVLEDIPGVVAADVSLEHGEARVDFDPARASPMQLKAAVEEAGYDAA